MWPFGACAAMQRMTSIGRATAASRATAPDEGAHPPLMKTVCALTIRLPRAVGASNVDGIPASDVVRRPSFPSTASKWVNFKASADRSYWPDEPGRGGQAARVGELV